MMHHVSSIFDPRHVGHVAIEPYVTWREISAPDFNKQLFNGRIRILKCVFFNQLRYFTYKFVFYERDILFNEIAGSKLVKEIKVVNQIKHNICMPL